MRLLFSILLFQILFAGCKSAQIKSIEIPEQIIIAEKFLWYNNGEGFDFGLDTTKTFINNNVSVIGFNPKNWAKDIAGCYGYRIQSNHILVKYLKKDSVNYHPIKSSELMNYLGPAGHIHTYKDGSKKYSYGIRECGLMGIDFYFNEEDYLVEIGYYII